MNLKKKTMNKHGFPTPKNRAEFEHNIAQIYESGLRKSEYENKSSFENFVTSVGKDLQKVNFLPNGRLDLLSINESLRLHGNSMNWMKLLPPIIVANNVDASKIVK